VNIIAMKKSSSKTLTIVIVVALVGAAVYFYYQGGVSSGSSSLLQTQSAGADVGSAELDLLNQIRSLSIDSTFFSDPAFQSLQDYSVTIPTENVGRPNPFAPLPGAAVIPVSNKTGH
jgi:hypothetical protein